MSQHPDTTISLEASAHLGIEALCAELAKTTANYAHAVGTGANTQEALKDRIISLEDAISLAMRAQSVFSPASSAGPSGSLGRAPSNLPSI